MTIRLPEYNPHDQPAYDAISGVRIGAKKPPTLPPVLSIPPADPTSSFPIPMAIDQNGPSQTDVHPIASDSSAAVSVMPGVMVARNSSTAPEESPTMGTMRRPNRAP